MKYSKLVFSILTIALLIFPWGLIQAQTFPSDAVTKGGIIELNAGNSYSYSIDGGSTSVKTVLNVSLSAFYTASSEVTFKCNAGLVYIKMNTALLSDVIGMPVQDVCNGEPIKIISDSTNVTLVYSIIYVPRDIANTDDPRLMPQSMVDFYENASILLNLIIFWGQICLIAYFGFYILLYKWFYVGTGIKRALER